MYFRPCVVALCTLWLKFACGQVSSPRLYRLRVVRRKDRTRADGLLVWHLNTMRHRLCQYIIRQVKHCSLGHKSWSIVIYFYPKYDSHMEKSSKLLKTIFKKINFLIRLKTCWSENVPSPKSSGYLVVRKVLKFRL